MTNIITVRNMPECITATFAGPDAAGIIALFGCSELPCPQAACEAAADELRRNFPNFEVVIA